MQRLRSVCRAITYSPAAEMAGSVCPTRGQSNL